MAGGLGSRLSGLVKPLVRVCGEAIIERVIKTASMIGRVYVAYTRFTRNIIPIASRFNVEFIETSGKGFVYDLNEVFMKTGFPVLTLPADTPFITYESIRVFLEKACRVEKDVVTLEVCLPNKQCRATGIGFFRRPSGSWSSVRVPFSIEYLDIDSPRDLTLAYSLCRLAGKPTPINPNDLSCNESGSWSG